MIFRRIRELREDHDLTQAALADYLGVRQTTYSKYELGRIEVPAEVLIKLADYYQVSLDYLVGPGGQAVERPSFPPSVQAGRAGGGIKL